MDRDLVARFLLLHAILKQRVDAHCEVELDEEEKDAKLGDLKAEEHSDEAEDEREYQEEDVEEHVRDEEASRALKNVLFKY